MNHKEALQMIIEVTLDQSTANKISTEALQSESEQPTSPSIEKMAEEILRDACPVLFKPNTDVKKAIITAMEEYAQLKVNNSLDIAIAHYEKLSEEGSNQAYVVAKYLKTLKP